MQYWYFLGLPGLKFVSRYQLVFALLMFLGSPAWIGMLVLGTLATASANNLSDIVEPTTAIVLFLITFVMWFTPKYSTVVDVLTRPEARRVFGGTAWFFLGVFIETLFSILLVPIMWFGHTVFLIGLLFGRRIGWIGQTRDDHSVPLSVAIRNFWAQTLLGVASLVILAMTHPAAIPIASFIAAGLALSIPLAILTSSPQLGDVMARIGLCGLPEERDVPPALRSLVRAGATPQPA